MEKEEGQLACRVSLTMVSTSLLEASEVLHTSRCQPSTQLLRLDAASRAHLGMRPGRSTRFRGGWSLWAPRQTVISWCVTLPLLSRSRAVV